ncbi:MAG: hypothetical protein CM15mP25_2280 [Gammaproteobacteria bacterium]|nr:MAG: hypothetical protein CM15mP25_2280 [Gammaproteobacteria bacterium]
MAVSFSSPWRALCAQFELFHCRQAGLLDIYTPVTQGARRPVLLHVHGGAWMMGHKSHQGQPLLHRMVELGWVGVSINYRLALGTPIPPKLLTSKRRLPG